LKIVFPETELEGEGRGGVKRHPAECLGSREREREREREKEVLLMLKIGKHNALSGDTASGRTGPKYDGEYSSDEEMKIPRQESNEGPPATEEQYQERFWRRS